MAALTERSKRMMRRIPIVHQLRQSVGLQRGMLIAGLIITAVFIFVAIFAPVIAPYGFSQLRDDNGLFGAQVPPGGAHPWGTTVGGYDVLSRVLETPVLARLAAILRLLR